MNYFTDELETIIRDKNEKAWQYLNEELKKSFIEDEIRAIARWVVKKMEEEK